jgi:hypothetical protein
MLGKGAAQILAPAEDLVTWPKPRHAAADGLHLPRQIRASNRVLWLAQPVQGPGDVRKASHDRPVSPVDGGRPNSNQHVADPDLGLVDVPHFQDFGGAVLLLNDRLHRGLPARSGLEPVVERHRSNSVGAVSAKAAAVKRNPTALSSSAFADRL